MRLIDADELEELFREVIGGIAKKPEMNGSLEHMVRSSAMVIEMIKDAPTIEERKTGRWIPHDCLGRPSIDKDVCSCCGQRFYQIAETGCEWKYCPNCGADMKGEPNES